MYSHITNHSCYLLIKIIQIKLKNSNLNLLLNSWILNLSQTS